MGKKKTSSQKRRKFHAQLQAFFTNCLTKKTGNKELKGKIAPKSAKQW